MEHTKEPWRVGGWPKDLGHETEFCVDTDGGSVLYILGRCNINFPEQAKYNARRIVACVNACAGHSTEELENGPSPIVSKLLNQRDELLAALEDCLDDSREVLGNYEQLYGEHYKQHRIISQRETVAKAVLAIANAKL